MAIPSCAADAVGISVVDSVGTLSEFLGRLFIGCLTDKASSTDVGRYMLATALALGGPLAMKSIRRLAPQQEKRDA